MKESVPCLCLIDGSGYVFRAFYALPPMHRSDGTPTNAVYGFTSMMLNLLGENKCPYLVVVFDAKRKNFRHDLYPNYKANRKELPPELIPQFSLIRQTCDSLNVPWVEKEGYEADDLIATYTRLAKEQNLNIRIISADKDLMQLIDEQTTLYDPMKKKDIAISDVMKKFGVLPHQVTDVQALMGDSSDNIPGAKGIGPKTAANLIQQFSSIEQLYQNLDKIPHEKQRETLRLDAENVHLSKKLAQLDTHVPIELDLPKFQRQNLDTTKAIDFLTLNGFPSLIKRLPTPPSNVSQEKKSLQRLATLNEIHGCIQRCLTLGKFSFDIVSDKNEYLKSITLYDGENLYQLEADSVDKTDLFATASTAFSTEIQQELQSLFTSSSTKIGWDIKKNQTLLKKAGITLSGPYEDILLMGYLLEGNHQLEFPLSFVEKYISPTEANRLAQYWYQVFPILQKEVEQQKLDSLYRQTDLPLVEFLCQMEQNGILVNQEQLKHLSQQFDTHITDLIQQIYTEAREEFNPNSPQQLGTILFEKRQLKGGKKGPSGHWLTDVKVLEKLVEEQQDILSELILKYRGLTKLKSTYIDDLLARCQISPRIHTTFSMVSTNTGRLASSNPNLQNISIKSDDGKQIRSAFVAEKGFTLLSADYSQIELRLIAHVANVQKLKNSFLQNEDIHTRTASQILNIPLEQITPDQRRQAKAVNFGIIYGISGFGLARNLHISREQATRYINAYFEQYPEIKNYMDETIRFVEENGFVLTPFGRKIFIEGLQNPATRQFAHRAAINAPIQGGAADIIKMAMVNIQQALKQSKFKARPLLQIHDELIFEVPDGEVESFKTFIKNQMEQVVQLSVPLITEIGIGQNWKDAH